ncbi:MAG: 3-oxoadipyl-CoA thiolase [Flectobacillus sp.]|jgi:3-oxoadipyl-CoA thiolase|uniref:Beta-ketoadipyl-CoA thiolase n=1 Tax=Flectobacillus longus TaxID=2984207 RepID=A0ABT6YTR4_9BACT|nr:3-oxoadipyl-CoA thiolase [Flectobacillus longus]MDI9866993.1 3-oxoadipyl-CoA thiolase [Flectobacillus longus]NBA75244.1 3-oxoadipyl-CoA thiolase [Emticicia sp. ODNR4P]
MKTAYIIDAIRTPIGSFGGSLSSVRADDLAALAIKELVARNPQIPVETIGDVILGCHNQAGEDNRNVARMALLLAGLPYTIAGETVNRLCASGMSAVINASRAIQTGDADVMIAGGMEHMTRGPWVISKTSKPFGNDAQMFDSSFGWRFVNPLMHKMYGTDAMGVTAENLVELYGISREDQDLFAFRSQQKASQAQSNGRLAEEIIAVSISPKKGEIVQFEKDEFIKPQTSLEKLAQLRPAFKKEGGSVTAGNASGLNDGAAAMYLASEEAVVKYGLKPLAKVVSSAVVGVEPRIMGIGPVPATQKALERAGLTLDQIDIIELNEAFAAQSLACTRALGLADDDSRINPNGGAIALGHPLGMSGTRLIQTASLELHKQNKRYALCTMCVGVGQGYAVIIEKV